MKEWFKENKYVLLYTLIGFVAFGLIAFGCTMLGHSLGN